MAGLDHLKGLFQLSWFCDSMILPYCACSPFTTRRCWEGTPSRPKAEGLPVRGHLNVGNVSSSSVPCLEEPCHPPQCPAGSLPLPVAGHSLLPKITSREATSSWKACTTGWGYPSSDDLLLLRSAKSFWSLFFHAGGERGHSDECQLRLTTTTSLSPALVALPGEQSNWVAGSGSAESNQRGGPESSRSTMHTPDILQTCQLRAYDLPGVLSSISGLRGAHSSIRW